eukprot:6921364-Pyramimonas_sp.AAC.1
MKAIFKHYHAQGMTFTRDVIYKDCHRQGGSRPRSLSSSGAGRQYVFLYGPRTAGAIGPRVFSSAFSELQASWAANCLRQAARRTCGPAGEAGHPKENRRGRG